MWTEREREREEQNNQGPVMMMLAGREVRVMMPVDGEEVCSQSLVCVALVYLDRHLILWT